MTDECQKHRGRDGQKPLGLDQVMKDLPENQSGAGRHKCPYCAYERGQHAERDRIKSVLQAAFDSLQPAERDRIRLIIQPILDKVLVSQPD